MRRDTALDSGSQLPIQMQRSPRRKVVVTGMLEAVTGTQKVSVKNLSCTGAMIEGTTVPPKGREVILKAGKLDCFCRVVWSEGSRCGLEFDEPIPMADVLELHGITAEAAQMAAAEEAAEWFRSQGALARM